MVFSFNEIIICKSLERKRALYSHDDEKSYMNKYNGTFQHERFKESNGASFA